MVIRLLQSMFHQHPRTPMYQEIWDAGFVMKYFQNGPRTADLSSEGTIEENSTTVGYM